MLNGRENKMLITKEHKEVNKLEEWLIEKLIEKEIVVTREQAKNKIRQDGFDLIMESLKGG